MPFVEKGRGSGGVDCWGLVQMVFKNELDIDLPGYESSYESTEDRKLIERVIFDERKSKWVEVDKPRSFDVALLRMASVPMHVGIVTKPNNMIHSAHGINTVVEKLDSMKWKNKIAGYFRYETGS